MNNPVNYTDDVVEVKTIVNLTSLLVSLPATVLIVIPICLMFELNEEVIPIDAFAAWFVSSAYSYILLAI